MAGGTNEIELDPSLQNGTLALTLGEIDVSSALTIDGTGAPGVDVVAGAGSRVFDATASMTIADITLRDGDVSAAGDDGGCILSTTDVTITGGILAGCRAQNGGGVRSAGDVSIVAAAVVRDNVATAVRGGGVAADGDVIVAGSQIGVTGGGNTALGQGGGVWAGGSVQTDASTSFVDNAATSSAPGLSYGGGGIWAGGDVVVTGSTFTGNTTGNIGGSIRAEVDLTISGATVTASNNGAVFGQCDLSISSSTFTGNDRGAIVNTNCASGTGSLIDVTVQAGTGNTNAVSLQHGGSISDSTFTGNASTASSVQSAGIVFVAKPAIVSDSTFTGNTSSFFGALVISQGSGTSTISDSTFAANANTAVTGALQRIGGALTLLNGSDPTTVTGSTFTGNTAPTGGAIGAIGVSNVTVTNSTITGNTATGFSVYHGGGVFAASSDLSLGNVTVDGNSGGSGANLQESDAPNSITVANSIVSSPAGGDSNCGGSIVDDANNVFSASNPGACEAGTANTVTGDPLLAPLADNGGPTQTQELQPGSAAINLIPEVSCPASDQRGVASLPGQPCDAGAFQTQTAVTPTTTVPAPTATTGPSGTTAPSGRSPDGPSGGTLPLSGASLAIAAVGATLMVSGAALAVQRPRRRRGIDDR